MTGVLALSSGCAALHGTGSSGTSQARVPAAQSPESPASPPRYEAGVELPGGPGRDILISQCLNCHELSSLELFSSFYGYDSWRSLVISMRANGAVLDDGQAETVARYLASHFGIDTQ